MSHCTLQVARSPLLDRVFVYITSPALSVEQRIMGKNKRILWEAEAREWVPCPR